MSRESHAECPNEPKATVGIGKDPNDMGTSANLLVEALKHVGRFQVFAVGERQAEVGQGLFDVVLDPAVSLGYFLLHLASQAARSRRSYIQRNYFRR